MISVEVSNPFPGLRPFEPEEDYLFFGRETQVDELLGLLRQTHFLSVVGGSGSGKSSLVRAGMIPALYGGAMAGAGSRWRIAMFRPGEDPLGRMAASLKQCGLIDSAEVEGNGEAMLEATLRRSSLGLAEAYHMASLGERDNLLVIVDQFEELFRYRASGRANYQDDAVAFVKLLLAAPAQDSRIYIALTMRSDFIGNCADYPGLPATVSQGQYLVPKMIRSELREAITKPIGVAGAEIAPRLVVRLLNEAGEDPEQLPVLQHALMRTYEYWKGDHKPGEPVDIRHYEAIGTMANALSVHADDAFAELKSDREKYIAEKAFKTLTDTDELGRRVRRPTSLKEICAIGDFSEKEATGVLDRFREAGRAFLAPPAHIPLQSATVIDLSHESLMRVWKRLDSWEVEQQRARALYLRLVESAERHASHEQSLWRDPELSVALKWLETNKPNTEWAQRYRPGFDSAISFLKASQKARDNQRIFRIATIAALVLIALIAIGIYALNKAKENETLKATNQHLNETTNRLQQENDDLRTRLKVKTPGQVQVVQPQLENKPKVEASTPPAQAPAPQQQTPTPAPVAPKPAELSVEMVQAQNNVRAKLGLPPLVWSNRLANEAQKWADTLASSGELKLEGRFGQNVGRSTPVNEWTATMLVEKWASEASNYDYNKNACIGNATCLNYVQMVWRATTSVGCGHAQDATHDLWVCDYDPPGAVANQKPY